MKQRLAARLKAWPVPSRISIPLWVRLGLPIVLIIALAIGFIDFLNYFNYQKTYRQLNASRMLVIGEDLRQAVEGGIQLGLAPRENARLDKALIVAEDGTDGLDFVAVTDDAGNPLAGAGRPPDVHDWGVRLAGIGKATFWQGADENTYQVGLPYRNSFGLTAGAVVLGYHKSDIDRATASMQLTLLADWVMAASLFGVAALFGVWWLTRSLESELTQAKSALKPAPGEPVPVLDLPLLGPEIECGIPELTKRSSEAESALAAAAGAR